jgi:hypothetical protein
LRQRFGGERRAEQMLAEVIVQLLADALPLVLRPFPLGPLEL